MKKKKLNHLNLKKSTVANFKEQTKGGLACEVNTGSCNSFGCYTQEFCPSEQTCQTFDFICGTQITCGPQTIVTMCFC